MSPDTILKLTDQPVVGSNPFKAKQNRATRAKLMIYVIKDTTLRCSGLQRGRLKPASSGNSPAAAAMLRAIDDDVTPLA